MQAGTIEYIKDVVNLLLVADNITDDEKDLFPPIVDGVFGEYDETTIERILFRAAKMNCMSGEVHDFWDKVSFHQRNRHKNLGLPAVSKFINKTCPCYICNGKCLKRLYGKNPVRKSGDEAKGFLQWEKGHIFPNMLGKNTNEYNMRIICSECNRNSSSTLPYHYALSILPITVKSLATEEAIVTIQGALDLYFEHAT